MKRIHFITCVLLTAAVDMYGQLTTEYFFDTDPGHGKATQETTKAGDNALTLRTSQLDAGMHLLGIRSADGEGRWSPTLTSPIYVFAPKTDVAAAEWFVDTDPGYGKGTSMPASAGSNVLVISTKGMSSGMHLICVRSRSLSGPRVAQSQCHRHQRQNRDCVYRAHGRYGSRQPFAYGENQDRGRQLAAFHCNAFLRNCECGSCGGEEHYGCRHPPYGRPHCPNPYRQHR